MNKETFQRGMARMGAALSVAPTPGMMATYWEELSDLDDLTFTAAVKASIRASKKMFALPTIGEILSHADHIQQVQGMGQPTALDAWGEFRKKVTLRLNLDLLGRNPEAEAQRVGLTPLEMQLARRLGGFAHLMGMPAKDLDWKAKEFAAVYGECVERQRTEDQLVALEPARSLRTPLLAETGE